MSFVNEKLTPEQKEDFARREIRAPRCSDKILCPNFRTIDRERNACLINIGAYHDMPEEEQFVFIYNSGIFLFTLQMCNISDTTKAWKFKKYTALNDSEEIEEGQLMTVFKEALSEYKYNGLPDGYKQQFVMEISF